MSENALKKARDLTINGFYYENLVGMAAHCREESRPDRLLSAFVLNRFFVQLADELGEGPVLSSELRKREVRYRNAVNLALEKAMAGAPREEQDKLLVELVQLLWNAS
ncbi:MAG: hypothetical protein ACQET7_13625 [Thermodesulfobacteriota bacterium]